MDTVIAVIVVGISIVGVLLLVPLGGEDQRATRPAQPSRDERAPRARRSRGPARGRHRRGHARPPADVAATPPPPDAGPPPPAARPAPTRADAGTLVEVRPRDRVRSALALVGLLVVVGAVVGGLIALGAIVVDDVLRDAADASVR